MSDFLNADVVAGAFPPHGRELTAEADAAADRLIEAYRARIADENEYWAGLYGVVLTGRGVA